MKSKKWVKRLLLVTMAVGMVFGLPITGNVVQAADEVTIDATNFPDAVFREYVSDNVDTDEDGILSEEEIADCIRIDIGWGQNVANLKGIEYFTVLKELYCSGNQLSDLNVSKNVKLEILSCGWNELSSLNVSENLNLKYLHCGNNSLSNLSVVSNTQLETLDCFDNKLSSLDVSRNIKLVYLDCASNNLKNLNINKNIAVEYLDCGFNKLSNLNLKKNIQLKELYCYNNKLKALDLSKNKKLSILYCGNNKILKLDLKKNTKITTIYCYSNKINKLNVKKNTKLKQIYCDTNVNVVGARKKVKFIYYVPKSNAFFQISSSSNGTAKCIGSVYRATDVVIPATMTVNGKKYKITSICEYAFCDERGEYLKKVTIGKNVKSIGRSAFLHCFNLKTITIKTNKLTKKSVGDYAFLDIHSKATIKVPAKKLSAYKKLLKARGVGQNVKIKK